MLILMMSIHKILVLWGKNLTSKIRNQMINNLNSRRIHTQTIFPKTKIKTNKIMRNHNNK